VPRYYENDKATTIATKGSREILLRKSSTSHKKFTFTPFITASGKFLIKHALFSNLKNIPKAYDKRCKVDVNATAMWNLDLVQKYIDEAVRKCRGPFVKSDVLIILDSYGVHIKFVKENEQYYAELGVHFAVVPPNLTGLLQPLDVCINRSFQEYFDDCTDSYQSESLKLDINKTLKGNVKMPSVEAVTNWVGDWAATKTVEDLRKAFDVCGLVPVDEFSADRLHPPLREIWSHNFDSVSWVQKYSSYISSPHVVFDDRHQIFERRYAFFHAIFSTIEHDFEDNYAGWQKIALASIHDFLKEDPTVAPIYEKSDKDTIAAGWDLTPGLVEFYAVAQTSDLTIHVITLNDDDVPVNRTIFDSDASEGLKGYFIKRRPCTVIYDSEYNPNDLCFVEIESENEGSDAKAGSDMDDETEIILDDIIEEEEFDGIIEEEEMFEEFLMVD
jgi:hypothetical protein